ncbi:ribosome-associated toxin RatA of RatAB toxin-antitoxin module [Bradyrhizobium sp. AZCC 1610]|uniref:SRPBCC family protein n=1 Tax=Bradyrhizobium sp. AZCC 1610 TaxID=3117020 RepID=UPI002FEFD508
MTTAYYSTVLNHPLETVWALIRDFNNYPAYIEGVSESVIEDDQGGATKSAQSGASAISATGSGSGSPTIRTKRIR